MDDGFWSEQRKKRESGFKAMNLEPGLLRAIFALGFAKPWPVQEKAIHLCLKGRNVFAKAQPGCGKTIALCISVLQRFNGEGQGIQIIIVAATSKLVQMIADTLRELMTGVVKRNEVSQNKPKEEGKPTSQSHKCFESTKSSSSSEDDSLNKSRSSSEEGSFDFDWDTFKISAETKADKTPKSPTIIVCTHEYILKIVRSNKIDLSTVKLFAMDEPSGMLEKSSRQIIEFAEIKSFLPESVQVLVFHSSLSKKVLKACSEFVPSVKFINCKKDKRVIQGIDQFYVSIQVQVCPDDEVVQVGKGEDASAMIERIFNCKSYYDIFKLLKVTITEKIIEKYRYLAGKIHPDKCSAAHSKEAFQLINHAKRVLVDEKKRKEYDCGGGDFPRPIQFKPKPNNEIERSSSELKLGSLCRLLKSVDEEKKSMIFCDDSDEVSEVSQKMIKEGYTTAAVHSKGSLLAQDLELLKFCDGSARFLVTTTLSGRAVIAPRVHLVINYDLPANCVDYARRLVHFGPLEQREGAVINFITKESEKKMIGQFEVYYDMKIEERSLNNVFKTCQE